MSRPIGRGRRIAVLVALGLVLASCGDPDQDLADAGLLRIDDFPPGFRTLPAVEEPPNDHDGEGPRDCEPIENVTGVGAVIEESAGPFAGGDAVAGNDVAVYRDTEIAERVLQAWADEDAARACMELTLSAFVDLAGTNPIFDAAFGGYEVSADPLDIATAGDQHAAWRGTLTLHGPEQQGQITIDIVVVRIDRVVTTFVTFGMSTPADGLRDRLVDAVTGRLSAAQ